MEAETNTQALSRKIYMELSGPDEEDFTGDRERILEALPAEFHGASMGLTVMRTLYPMCRESGWKLTATLVWNGFGWEVLQIEPGDTTDRQYGLAVDYGSTTIAMQAVDLISGEILAQQTIFNPQIAYGEEILSRIFYTKNSPERMREIREATAAGFNELIEKCAQETGVEPRQFSAMTVGGNTTMIQFLLELDAWPVFETPFAPAAQNPGFLPAKELGINLPGYVYFYPAAANYLGGDVISGLTAAGIDRSEQLSVFIDIGTNGELAAGNSEFLLAGAGAAGPALEGGISRYGMRADQGAVDHVKITDGRLEVHVIGETAPRGICGSGIVDLLAEMFLNGWIDSLGTFSEGISDRIISVSNHLDEERTEAAVCYAWAAESGIGQDLVFTQSDVTEFIRTKAAAHTMVEYLLEEFGLDASDISRFYLAGAFGKYLDLEAAITIGMYPDLPREKFVILGNSSLDGARNMLLDRNCQQEAERIVRKITYVQFGTAGDFVGKMHAAQFLPYTDLEQYPTVKAKLEQKRTETT